MCSLSHLHQNAPLSVHPASTPAVAASTLTTHCCPLSHNLSCQYHQYSTVQYSTVQYNPNLHVEQDEEVPLTWCGVRSDRGNISFVKSYSNSKFLIRILYTEDLHFFCHSNKNKKNHVNCASLSCRDLMFNLNKRTIKTKLNITHNNRLAHTSLLLSSLKHDRNRINILSKHLPNFKLRVSFTSW